MGRGGKDMYRHTIKAKHKSRQRNLPNACKTKGNLHDAGNNAIQASRFEELKKVMKCPKAVALSSIVTRYAQNKIFISLFAYCQHLKRLSEMYSGNIIYLRILRLCPVSPLFQCGGLDSIPASTSR